MCAQNIFCRAISQQPHIGLTNFKVVHDCLAKRNRMRVFARQNCTKVAPKRKNFAKFSARIFFDASLRRLTRAKRRRATHDLTQFFALYKMHYTCLTYSVFIFIFALLKKSHQKSPSIRSSWSKTLSRCIQKYTKILNQIAQKIALLCRIASEHCPNPRH